MEEFNSGYSNRKSNRFYFIIISTILLFLNISAYAKYSGGTGEPNDPYLISTPEDLNDIGLHPEDFNSCFLMVNDINMAGFKGTEFNIIGYSVDIYDHNEFTGVFDGNNHAISNFTYDSNELFVGIFGEVGNYFNDDLHGVIKNLALIDPNVKGIGVGSLIGIINNGTVENCHVIGGNVYGNYFVGGMIGSIGGDLTGKVQTYVYDCGSNVSVVGAGNEVGGFAGNISDALVSRCYSTGDVSSDGNNIGGFCGMSLFVHIEDSYSKGNVSGNESVGGLIGKSSGSVITCYSSGEVTGNANVGGLIGMNQGMVHFKCFWDSDINPTLNGISDGFINPNVIGLTTEEMQMESTFAEAGWDMVNVWGIGDGQTYPYLQKYMAGDINHDGIVNAIDIAIMANEWLQED